MENSVRANIQFAFVDPIDLEEASENPEFYESLAEAQDYLRSFGWVKKIERSFVGDYFEGVLGVYLFKIVPLLVGVDEYVWVIVGDIPSAYITVEESPNPAAALDSYLGAMQEWVEAVLDSRPTADLIPVEAAATRENALDLKSRLEFIDEKILPLCTGELESDREA